MTTLNVILCTGNTQFLMLTYGCYYYYYEDSVVSKEILMLEIIRN